MLDTGNQGRLSITKAAQYANIILQLYGQILIFSVRKVSFASEHALMKVRSTDSVAHNKVKLNERTSSVWHLKLMNFFVGFCTKQTRLFMSMRIWFVGQVVSLSTFMVLTLHTNVLTHFIVIWMLYLAILRYFDYTHCDWSCSPDYTTYH